MDEPKHKEIDWMNDMTVVFPPSILDERNDLEHQTIKKILDDFQETWKSRGFKFRPRSMRWSGELPLPSQSKTEKIIGADEILEGFHSTRK